MSLIGQESNGIDLSSIALTLEEGDVIQISAIPNDGIIDGASSTAEVVIGSQAKDIDEVISDFNNEIKNIQLNLDYVKMQKHILCLREKMIKK